jgi:translation initiation factor IF-3
MKRSYRRSKKDDKKVKDYRINRAITAQEVLFINEEEGSRSVMSLREALDRAAQAELDLVEVSPAAKPPVVKLMDYGKFQYQRDKQMRKQKALQKKSETKGVRLSARIGQHDLELRVRQSVKFLAKGAKVKADLRLRGRERYNIDHAKTVMDNYIKLVLEGSEVEVVIEQQPKRAGNSVQAIIAPKN